MLIGLGLGPGDPELLTLRAVRLLREADEVYVPGRIAYDLVAPYRKPVLLDFPMTEDEGQITASLTENARQVAMTAESGCAVFGILGDPNFFSTFSRLCVILAKEYPDIEYRTEPGISSITAFAAAAGISLSGGFIVSDGGVPDTLIQLKVRRPRERMAELRSEGYRTFVLVEKMYLPDMKVYRNEEIPENSEYLSIMYAGR